MQKGGMPKPSSTALTAFESMVPDSPHVSKRPMFGNRAAFVNGNMFAGLYGEDLFVRLPADRLEELYVTGGKPFEPMPGRGMRGYGCVHPGWIEEPAGAASWVAEALEFTSQLPAKESTSRPKKRR